VDSTEPVAHLVETAAVGRLSAPTGWPPTQERSPAIRFHFKLQQAVYVLQVLCRADFYCPIARDLSLGLNGILLSPIQWSAGHRRVAVKVLMAPVIGRK
jgi:hypothetical protein